MLLYEVKKRVKELEEELRTYKGLRKDLYAAKEEGVAKDSRIKDLQVELDVAQS